MLIFQWGLLSQPNNWLPLKIYFSGSNQIDLIAGSILIVPRNGVLKILLCFEFWLVGAISFIFNARCAINGYWAH